MTPLKASSFKGRLLSGTVIPVALGVGLAVAAMPAAAGNPLPVAVAKTRSQAPAKPETGRRNGLSPLPTAVARPVQLAACGAKAGCGACGAKKGCGACGAKKSCGACGAKKGCGACGAKKGCGACGACGGASPVSAACVIPRLAKANPCAAKRACGACGAKKACGACGAKKGCGACGACGGKPAITITNEEASAAYACLQKELAAAYAKSGSRIARSYAKWKRYSKVAYVSETHANRLVNNYGNTAARRYINYDKVKRMPAGAVLAKDSFQVQAGGKLALGPLFIMEKMARGWLKASGDWKYTMIMPDGTVFGATKGKDAAKMKFCYECHIAAAEKDSLFFLPEEHRVAK